MLTIPSLLFAGCQTPPKTNDRIIQYVHVEDITVVPPNGAFMDCHNNTTNWLWIMTDKGLKSALMKTYTVEELKGQ